jgi:hypothetical protein
MAGIGLYPNLHFCAARDLLGPWHAICFLRNKPSPGGLESEPKWPVLRPDVTITSISGALGDRKQSNSAAPLYRRPRVPVILRLHGERILPLRGVQANARAGWQLQHGRVLTFA